MGKRNISLARYAARGLYQSMSTLAFMTSIQTGVMAICSALR